MSDVKTENGNGVKLEIHKIGEGIEKYRVLNWPMPFTFYTDPDVRRLTGVYSPGVVHVKDGLGDISSSRIGCAFPPQELALEKVVHPIVSISTALGEFGGVDLESHSTAVKWANYFLQEQKHPFRADHNPENLKRAEKAGYLRVGTIEGVEVYFPQEKAVRAMCNQRMEDVLYSISLHTGAAIGTGHKRPPPD
ncbi:MAG: hypothetical protein HY362_03055 [Candidatus Aenigmarchaeota archaeon]|nr:hypothetical protein [Candidatus Aenigmarchaeota archaeon]